MKYYAFNLNLEVQEIQDVSPEVDSYSYGSLIGNRNGVTNFVTISDSEEKARITICEDFLEKRIYLKDEESDYFLEVIEKGYPELFIQVRNEI